MNDPEAIDTLHQIIPDPDDPEGGVAIVSVTRQERDYIDARLKGRDEKEALRDAGMTEVQLWRSKQRGDLQLYFRDKIVEAGLGHEIVIDTLKAGLKAEKYATVTEESVMKSGDGGKGGTNQRSKELSTITVPDHGMRHTFLRTLLELQGVVGGAEINPANVTNNLNFITRESVKGKDTGSLLEMTVARARAIKEGRTFVVQGDIVEETTDAGAE